MIDPNSMESIIPRIHSKDIFGIIYEQGAGVGITSTLQEYPGASNTIYASHCLYNEESVLNFFDQIRPPFERSVSIEACSFFIGESKKVKRGVKVGKKINFHLMSTFQLPEGPGMTKHGWIGLDFNGLLKFYHLSFPSTMSRKECIKAAGEDGCRILFARNQMALVNTHVDMIFDEYGDPDFNFLYETMSLSDKNLASVIKVDDGDIKLERLETFLRKGNPVVYKGSFNPWHEGHDWVSKRPGDAANLALSVSINTIQKGHLRPHELKDRIHNLMDDYLIDSGTPLILCTRPTFKEFYALCKNKYEGDLTFLMGDDTLRRIVRDNDIDLFQEENKVKAICEPRTGYLYPGEANITYTKENPYKGISSTQIRNQQKTKQYD